MRNNGLFRALKNNQAASLFSRICVLLAVCIVAVFLASCGLSKNVVEVSEAQSVATSEAQSVAASHIYGSSFDKLPAVYFRYIPAEGISADSKIKFSENSPAKGLRVLNYHFESVYGAPQDISIIEIDPRKYRFKVVDHKGLKRTSAVAEEAGAVAAMNGTFYDMKKGGSVCYLQIDGQVADTTKGNDMRLRANGAVVIRNGKLSVESWSPEKEILYKECFLKDFNRFNYADQTRHSKSEHTIHSKYGNTIKRSQNKNVSVMATMPLLIKDGYAVELIYYKGFSDKRHPRSVVFEKDGKICLMVIDGRSKGNASGMTLDEVQRYLQSMDNGKGCQNAVNLDGGGSSTLWIKPSSQYTNTQATTAQTPSAQSQSAQTPSSQTPSAQTQSGVVNHPSDNGKFDHKGERRVANSIIVVAK